MATFIHHLLYGWHWQRSDRASAVLGLQSFPLCILLQPVRFAWALNQ